MRNISYLKDRPICVLGAGAIGKAMAADCKLAGNKEVRICDIQPFAAKSLYRVKENGITIYGSQVSLYGFKRSGTAFVDMVTDSVAEAVKGAGIIIVAIPSVGHEAFFSQLIPCLEDGQIIHIIPDSYGSFTLKKMMKEARCEKKVIMGGWIGPTFDARADVVGGVGLPRVKLGYRAISLKGSAMPASDNDVFMESIKYIGAFDSVVKGDGPAAGENILDVCLSLANPALHTVGLILGVGVLENFETILKKNLEDFSIYSHCFCPSISRVQYEFYLETVRIAEAIGVAISHHDKQQFFSRESIVGEKYMGPEYSIGFGEINHVAWGTGPTSVKSRYLTEDIPVGCHILHELGQRFGVKTPVIDSMITLAGIILETDYYEKGVTLADLGINEMSAHELLDYVNTGCQNTSCKSSM